MANEWDEIRQFLAMHYRFNDRLDTPFWKACRADVDLVGAQTLVDYYKENGPSTFGRNTLIRPKDIFGMKGYLCMLVGQRVTYRKTSTPSPQEWEIWNGIRAKHKSLAEQALTIPDAFAAIAAPNWKWAPDFWRDQ